MLCRSSCPRSEFEIPYLVFGLPLTLSDQMDEAVINGANLFFAPQFHIDPNTGNTAQNQWLLGLVNSAPYVCGAKRLF